jgi:hypothetical protein
MIIPSPHGGLFFAQRGALRRLNAEVERRSLLMKVSVVLAGEDDFKCKITIPKSWREGPATRLIEFIFDTYNKRDPNHQISASTHHLEIAKASGPTQIHETLIISEVVSHRDTIQIKFGAVAPRAAKPKTGAGVQPPTPPITGSVAGKYKSIADWNTVNPDYPTQAGGVAATITRKNIKVRREIVGGVECAHCMNWGCQKVFQIQDNGANSCSYHTQNVCYRDRGAPSYWKCCPDKTVAENFPGDDLVLKLNAIPGCVVGAHWDGSTSEEGGAGGSGKQEKDEK